jgi:hypothetical protein
MEDAASPTPDGPPPSAPELADALASTDPAAAELVRDERTVVYHADIAVPLRRYAMLMITNFHPHNPTSLYIAYAPGMPAFVLTRHPDRFAELARADGLLIETPEAALAWARAYQETTRTTDEIFYLVSTIDDVQTLNDSPLADDRQVAAFRARFAATIQPPEVSPEGPPYVVRLWAIREQTLELHRLRVEATGVIEDEIDIVASDLPLVFSG